MNRKHVVLFWVLSAASLLTGCASSQFRRIDASRELYETWPLETKQAVLDGLVEPGMTPEMVEMSWGKPTEVIHRTGTDEEIWIYRRGGYDNRGMYPGGGSGTTLGIGPGGLSGSTNMGMGIGGIGMGTGGMGGGNMNVPSLPPAPPEEKEVVFRRGVVHRADPPFPR